MTRSIHKLALYLLLALVSARAHAAVVYDEASNGDLSGVYSSPTAVNLSPGTNSLIASTGTFDVMDLEYVRVNVPTGYELSQLVLASFAGLDQTGFIGLQAGPAFTFSANDAFSNIGNMLGWNHFGPGVGDAIGTDLLPGIGQNAQGFTPPLTGSTYTFWIQQTGSIMNYQLDFVVAQSGAALPGDYNGNQTVDAADYTVWRDTLGASGAGLAADGNGDMQVNQDDYGVWKSNFGNGQGPASGSSVPEPQGLLLNAAGLLLASIWRAHHHRQRRT